jgi:glutathione S-transferase
MILYNAPSSYYSMIARLALLEAKIPFANRRMDIHLAKEQLSAWYTALNPRMTVPTLVDGEKKLIDSHDILCFAALFASNNWLDGDVQFKTKIDAIVCDFYAIPIEDITFAKAMIKFAPLHFIFPKILGKIVRKLQSELSSSKYPEAVRAKIALNEERITYFTQGSLVDKLHIERQRISAFLAALPAPSTFLLGNKLSSADIVLCVLLGRLKMIGEYGLVLPFPELDAWFNEMQQRSAFKATDIWQKFQLWRILLKC